MAFLDELKVVAKPVTQPATAEEHRRHKLIQKLIEQRCLAEAELGGTQYSRMKWVTVPNYDAEPERVQRAVRLKQWWFKDKVGTLLFAVRYGAKPIALSKDKSAIEVGSLDKLPSVINTLIKAVEGGELDAQLAAIRAERQFLPTKQSAKGAVKQRH